jgi:hypothetical protein
MPDSDATESATDSATDTPLNPLEAKRQAEAQRIPPPGTGGVGEGRKGSRGGNPKAPRHYNRHK